MFHIVDDDEHVRTFMAEVIGLLGYTCKAFACPVSYLGYINSSDFEKPYALLTDVQMPKMNGYELLDQVKRVHPDIRTAVISGFPKYEGEAKARSCAFLSKPVNVEKLGHLLKSFVACSEDGPDPKKYGCKEDDASREPGMNRWQCPHGQRCRNC
jgi:DNA-binding NtrC family response regulator